MCSSGGGGGGSTTKSETDYPLNPYRNDPDVQQYYIRQRGYDPATYKLTTADLTDDSEGYYDAWEAAYYSYQKDKTAKDNATQLQQQQDYMNLQKSMGEQQLAQQKSLQDAQIASQEKLTAMQQQMQQQQLEQQKLLQDQQLAFEKDSSILAADSKREIQLSTKKAKTQETFQAGRKASDRKNQGSVMASRGTKALQINTASGASKGSGLAVPV